MATLQRAITKRTVLRSSTTKLINKIEEFISNELDVEAKLNSLKEYHEQLTVKENNIKQLNLEIEQLVELDKLESEVITSEEYSEKIIIWKQRIINAIEKLSNSLNVTMIDNNIANAEGGFELASNIRRETKTVKLPKLVIKTFYGDSAYYLEFINQFESAIHLNETLSKIDKFNYLKSYLGGAAAHCINGFALTGENYDAALALLKNRFGNKNALIQAHLNHLLKIQVVRNINDTIGLRKLFDRAEVQIRNLESLGVKTETFGNLLSPILLERIPRELVLEFNRTYSYETWNFRDLMEFLDKEIQSRERTQIYSYKSGNFQHSSYEYKGSPRRFEGNKRFGNKFNEPQSTASFATNVKNNCVFCNSPDHEFCESLNVSERKNKIKMDKKCFICFGFHMARFCKAKIDPCKHCNSKFHHYSLCYKSNDVAAKESVEEETNAVTQCNSSTGKSNSILLQTCSVIACSGERSKLVRILLDNGSERTWITQSLAEALKVKPIRKERLSIFSFGNIKPAEKLHCVAKLKLRNRHNPEKSIEIEALITDTITAAPISIPNAISQNIVKEKEWMLADACNSSDLNVQCLIGGDMFWKIVSADGVVSLTDTLSCIPTLFGFTLQGKQDRSFNETSVGIVSTNLSIGKSMEVLWDLETLGLKDDEGLSIADKEFITDFENGLNFLNGKYQTKLLWKSAPIHLMNNFGLAKRQFDNLIEGFKNNKWVASEYKEIIKEQFDTGIIEEATSGSEGYFMPHKPVVRENKTTTRVRCVFNCSSKTKDNLSLNDCLETGPNLNPNILNVILKFRKFDIAFSSDIEKAFLMIGIAEEDRKFLKFLWVSDKENENYKVMQMTRLPFGCTTSPFILSATIKKHIKQYEEIKPKAVEMLNSSLYVDDLYFGGQSVEEAFQLSMDAVSILKDGGFNLRKFTTNSEELNSLWLEKGIGSADDNSKLQSKVLGLNWNPERDILSLELGSLIEGLSCGRPTKRLVLHFAAMVFDPVGFIAPFVIRIKCLLQQIWQRGLEWDQQLPDDLDKKWSDWCREVQCLRNLGIPRMYFSNCVNTDKLKVQVHIFCDASPIAYGAVSYFRFRNDRGELITSFIMSKSRVSPLKKLSLPRLELMGAVVAARMWKFLVGLFENLLEEVFFWSDSEICLHWIKGSARDWKQFVSNRVLEIQGSTGPENWGHCPGLENPADKLTRGIPAASLLIDNIWFSGPPWLRCSPELWPTQHSTTLKEDQLERRSIVTTCVSTIAQTIINVGSFSNVKRLLRVTVWLMRLISKFKKCPTQIGPITADELQKAEEFWIKTSQNSTYALEVDNLKKGKLLPKDSSLYSLAPYLDERDILHVKGRLKESSCTIEEKHPILLPCKSTFKRTNDALKSLTEIIVDPELKYFISSEGITWTYIVELVPWWGGFYERLMKTIKEPLRKILGRALLTFEEMCTVLTEVETVVNNRPLTYVSNDVADLQPLTPAHFLFPSMELNEYPLHFAEILSNGRSTKESLARRKLYQTTLLRQFWRRWKEEYLLQLNNAHKLSTPTPHKDLKRGDVVLIAGTNKSKFLWTPGRVEEIIMGRDGLVRSCIVQTAKGQYKRPIQLLYPLEL